MQTQGQESILLKRPRCNKDAITPKTTLSGPHSNLACGDVRVMCSECELEFESCSATSCLSWGRSLGIPSPGSFTYNGDNSESTYFTGL